MARIAGIDLPKRKRVDVALTYIYCIGRSSAQEILSKVNIEHTVKTEELTDDEVNEIRKYIGSNYNVEGELRAEVTMNIKRMMDLGCYRGRRHRQGLPCRGQKTKTNARTRKGPRRGAARRK